MHPHLFWIGNFPIPVFGLMVAIGFLTGLAYSRRSFKRIPVGEDQLFDFVLVLMIAALVGSRIVYLIVEWESFIQHPWSMIFSRQGYVFYGGFLFATFSGIAYIRLKKMPGRKVTDAIAPAIALGHFFGRLGCYMNGCCYGRRCELNSFLFRFPKVEDPKGHIVGSPVFLDQINNPDLTGKGLISPDDPFSLPVHPTQLYEAGGLLILFYLLHRLLRRTHWPPGMIFLCYIAGYAILRFSVEFFRGDPRGSTIPGVLSTSQGIAIAALIGVLIAFPILRRMETDKKNESRTE